MAELLRVSEGSCISGDDLNAGQKYAANGIDNMKSYTTSGQRTSTSLDIIIMLVLAYIIH